MYVSKSTLVCTLPVGNIYKAEKFEYVAVGKKDDQWMKLVMQELNNKYEVKLLFREEAIISRNLLILLPLYRAFIL